MKFTDGKPILVTSYNGSTVGMQTTILGRPVIINEHIEHFFKWFTFSFINGLFSSKVPNIFINSYTIISAGIPDIYNKINAGVYAKYILIYVQYAFSHIGNNITTNIPSINIICSHNFIVFDKLVFPVIFILNFIPFSFHKIRLPLNESTSW